MHAYSLAARLSAGAIAAAAWLGLALYLAVEAKTQNGDWLAAVWVNLGFLTDLSNLITATIMTGVALNVAPLTRTRIVGLAANAICFVGIGFWVIGGRLVLGESALEDILLHAVTPLLGIVFWIAFSPAIALSWSTAALWLIWPIAYFTYALTRGAITNQYAYGFLNLNETSPTSVAITIGILVAIYAAVGLVLVGITKLKAARVRNV